jgi:hypothetical protein
MTIEIIEIHPPMITEFEPLATLDVPKLEKEKEIIIEARAETKTRVSTFIQFGKFRNKVNLQVDGFKQDQVTSTSIWTMRESVSFLFKKSKKQDLDSYKEYVKKLVEKIMLEYYRVEIDHLKVKLITAKAFN